MEFKVYKEFNSELQQIWTNFYSQIGATYSLSYEWCTAWFRHFGEEKELFIITGWEDNDLKFIAPFYINYKKSSKLFLLGTDPDFLDEFDILYKHQSYLLELINFIFEHNFEIDIKFISSEHSFFKYLVRRNEQEKLYDIKVHPYTLKPLVFKQRILEENPERKFKELKRKNRIARNEFNDEITYEFNPEKSDRTFDEFLSLHQQKWEALKSKPKSDFLRDLYLNYDFVTISRLFLKNKNITLAYDFKFTPSNKVLYYNICAFNHDYSALSPGSCIFCYELMSDLFKAIKYIDFGNGVFDYKYRFANHEKLILNMQVNLSWKRYKKIYYPLKKIKQRIQHVF